MMKIDLPDLFLELFDLFLHLFQFQLLPLSCCYDLWLLLSVVLRVVIEELEVFVDEKTEILGFYIHIIEENSYILLD